ncbi:MAG TPA: hypothetical protein PKE51_10895, partial [Gemmatimonadaceae bacterium]|nr:hypothetical protein [Gemmatimonadaceae bacterium]
VLDDLAALRTLAQRPELARADAALLPVTRTNMWLPERTSNAGSWGAAYYAADNPASGTTITYVIGRALRTQRAARLAREQATARRGEDVPQPTLDMLRAEALEESPQALLTITDADGRVVRRLTGPAGAGMHRVQWDLRWSGLTPVTGTSTGGRGGSRGPLVAPGTYTVSLALRTADGAVRDIGRETFTAAPPAERSSTVATDPAVQAFRLETARLQRAVLGTNALLSETIARVAALEAALPNAYVAVDSLQREARALARRLDTLRVALSGDNTPSRLQQPSEPGLLSRLNDIVGGHWSTQQAPTGTQRRQFEIVTRDVPPLLVRLRAIVERELPALEARAESAGVPWTPGRIPTWP